MKKQDRKKHKTTGGLGNQGSTFIIVMVAVGFLTVLGTIIIAVSTANLRMKQQEYTAKHNFYTDERVLDDIYHGIGKAASEYLAQSYAEVLAKVSDDGNPVNYSNQEEAFRAFSGKFVDKLINQYGDGESPAVKVDETKALLQSYITLTGTGIIPNIVVEEYGGVEVVPISSTDDTPYQYIFKDIVVKYRTVDDTGEDTGYEAAITTDIVIEVPYINFFRDSSRILEYVLIGNQGIYFNNGTRDIKGNVYAGINETMTSYDLSEGVYGGLNFRDAKVTFESNYLISKGDINLRKSDLTVGNTASMADTQVWAESIRTVEDQDPSKSAEGSTLTVNGNMYVANDLELNARESEVTLAGSYYGYNNARYVTWERKGNRAGKYYTAEHTQSSAILINGNDSTLDLSGLKTLVLSGVAYVDMASKAYSGTPGVLPDSIKEYATGESLALKSNQYIYLAPSSCLTITNPVRADEAPTDANVWAAGTNENWFGFKGFVDTDQPIVSRDVVHRTTGVTYRYYFLNFLDGERERYAGFILNMQDPAIGNWDPKLLEVYKYDEFSATQLQEAWEIKKSLQGRAGVTGIEIKEGAAADIYTRGALTRVSKGSETEVDSPLVADEKQLSIDYINKIDSNLYLHYIWLYEELDAKEGVALTTTPGDITPSALNANKPASSIVDYTLLVNAGVKETSYRDSKYKTIISAGNAPVLTGNFEGIIICKGDVTIPNGVSVKGMVIAGGKIYIQGNGTIEASRSVVQAILDEEIREESKKKDRTEANIGYATTYLIDINVNYSGTDHTDRISGTDYTEYMSYENWRKGEID